MSVDAATIDRALEGWTTQREAARARAMASARELVSAKLGRLEREDFEALFKLLHTDWRDGGETKDRFSRAFAGSSAHKLYARLPALNHWTERLWKARGDAQVASTLDAFWAVSKKELPGAGRSYPTVLLHARGPERYWPWLGVILDGHRAAAGLERTPRTGAAYIDYCEWVRSWRSEVDLSEHAIDLVLSVVGSPDDNPAKPEADAEPPAPSEVLELRLDLRLHERRECRVRLASEGEDDPRSQTWPESGALLPPVEESFDIAERGQPGQLDDLGRQLFSTLFHDPRLRERYQKARADATRGRPLRLVLRMHKDAGGQDCSVAHHPWELMIDPERGPLAIELELRLVREMDWLGPPGPSPSPANPLRVHVGLAGPLEFERLDLRAEWQQFRELDEATRDSSLLELSIHPSLDLATFDASIDQAEVFHYAGHGEPGELILEGPGRSAERLDGDTLRARLSRSAALRLAVLNACHGSIRGAGWISVAEAFVAKGVPAVLAMNGAVTDTSALVISKELHQRVAAGVDIELAVQRARWRAFGERQRSWFKPVLWTRCTSSFVLVDPQDAARDPVVAAQGRELERIEIRASAQVEVMRRLTIRQLVEPELREELADELLAEARGPEAGSAEPGIELERLLEDEAELERLAGQIRRRTRDPNAELRELISQLGSIAQAVPQLASAAAASPVARAHDAAPEELLLEAPEDDSEPLRLRAQDIQTQAQAILEDTKLVLDPTLVERCLVHLLAGRHLVLAGPPGTGKSTLAKALARAFGYADEIATANPDWTTFDTIGGLAPVSVRDSHGRAHLSYPFRPGCVLRAVEANWTRPRRPTWLVIDEMNRAPLDQAFGDLFTALVDQQLLDPRYSSGRLPIPKDFRLLCTTNTADRRLLFELSEALKRRFAFVEIPAFAPGERGLQERSKLLEQLGKRPALADIELAWLDGAVMDALEQVVVRVRVLVPLGLAQVLDVLTYVAVGKHYGAGEWLPLLRAALVDNILPLLESQPPALLEALAALLDGEIESWLEQFIAAQASFRPDPGEATVARALLGELAGYELPRGLGVDWKRAFEEPEGEPRMQRIIASAAQPCTCADELSRALSKLAGERHG